MKYYDLYDAEYTSTMTVGKRLKWLPPPDCLSCPCQGGGPCDEHDDDGAQVLRVVLRGDVAVAHRRERHEAPVEGVEVRGSWVPLHLASLLLWLNYLN